MAKSYWNEEIELIGDQDRMRLESEGLRHQISYNYNSSAFYRTKLESAGVRPDQIRDARDLARIPFMEKSEIAESQRDGDLLGVNQCAPLERIVRVQATGGTRLVVHRTLNCSLVGADQVSRKLPFVAVMLLMLTGAGVVDGGGVMPVRIRR